MTDAVIVISTLAAPDGTTLTAAIGSPISQTYTSTISNSTGVITVPEADLIVGSSIPVTVTLGAGAEIDIEEVNIDVAGTAIPIPVIDIQNPTFTADVTPWEFTWDTFDGAGDPLPTDGELKFGVDPLNLDQTTGASGGLYTSHRKYHIGQGQSGGHFTLQYDTTYYYEIISTDAEGNTSTVTGSFATPAQPVVTPGSWSNTVSLPTLSSPTVYEMHSENTATSNLSDFLGTGCAGKYYAINVGSTTQDVLIRMASGSGPLRYPIWVVGGRHNHFLGIDMDLEIQPGCDVGEGTLRVAYTSNTANVNPQVPGGMAIRSECVGATIVEGCNIDMLGTEGDPLVIRNYLRQSGGSSSAGLRDVYIVNSRLVGNDSLDEVPGVGDSNHGDTMHDQTASSPDEHFGSLYVENVTALASGNGLLFQGREGPLVSTLLRNYSWDLDYRYHGTRSAESAGLGFNIRTNNPTFDNVWLARSQESSSLDYGIIRGSNNVNVRYGASTTYNSSVNVVSEIHGGVPSQEFAPASATGLNYSSPF